MALVIKSGRLLSLRGCLADASPIHVVAARLGHADLAVTLRVCSHVLREHGAGISDIFAQAVKDAR
jgi:hypothetical protein